MKFSTFRQIAALSLLSVGLLVAVDFASRPRPLRDFFSSDPSAGSPSDRPHLSLWMNHLCCSGCLSGVREALAPLSWIGKVQMVEETALSSPEEVDTGLGQSSEYGNRVEVELASLQQVDFMELDAALRKAGLVAGRIELRGLAHFRLTANVQHMCCDLCVRAAEDITKAVRSTHRLKWLDSVIASKQKKTIVAYAHLNYDVDVAEYIEALRRIGYSPSTLHIVTGPET